MSVAMTIVWILVGVLTIVAIWYVGLILSLRKTFAQTGPALRLQLAVPRPNELCLRVETAPGVAEAFLESIFVNRQAAHALRLESPHGFVESLLEPTFSSDMTPHQRAEEERRVEEQNRQSIYFRGKTKVSAAQPIEVVFPIKGATSVPLEVSVTCARRVGVVGEMTFNHVSLPKVPLDG